jgi:hypothetical protein
MFLILKACALHFDYNHKMGYSALQVEDTVHLFVLIEIASYAAITLVLMLIIVLVSIRNEWQVLRAGPINNDDDELFAG